jgi:hypothetical protein
LALVCVTAAQLPTKMVAAATSPSSGAQSGRIGPRASRKMRASSAKLAAFDPVERKAVTGVGAPS